jgi:hypothetical protein
LENFWQASKLYPQQEYCVLNTHERCHDYCFRKYQVAMFTNHLAERHNRYAKGNGGAKVTPRGWVYTYPNGEARLFSYLESRQFYCNYYQRLAQETTDYARLVELTQSGMPICIAGYDGKVIRGGLSAEEMGQELMTYYLDPAAPFGHELCLVAMLTLPREQLPWIVHQTVEF